MKKYFKLIIPIALAFVLLIGSAVPFFATTYYIYDGYKYSLVDNNKIELCGWDDSSDTLVVPDSIVYDYFVSIDDYAFENNSVIKTADLSQAQHLTTIGTGAFSGCTALENIDIPEWTTNLSDYMFQDCTALVNVTINSPVTKINVQMFNRCSSLETFEIPDTVTTIEKYAFGNCSSLSKVIIPRSVEDISPTAFKNDDQLVIYCYYDSCAYQYAVDNNFDYYLLDGALLGDADGSGYISIYDVTTIQRHIADMEALDGIYLYASDIDRNGVVDINDATELQRFIAEYEVEYPIGEEMTQ